MIAKAISRYTRVPPRKAMLLTRPLKGLTVAEAYAILQNSNRRAAYFILNVLKSAFDNACKKNRNFKETDLYISNITADAGPMLKRYRAASMGRATMIRRRTSHLTIQLDTRELPETKEVAKKAVIKRPSIFRRSKESETGKNKGHKVTSRLRSGQAGHKVTSKGE